MEGSAVIGVVGGTPAEPRVAYLARPLPVSASVIELADDVEPEEVFRFAAPCAEGACRHFRSGECRLGERLVARVPRVTDGLPPCSIRARCRWWRERGADACARCPGVVTEDYAPSLRLREAATPD
jgi:hypothetical protein